MAIEFVVCESCQGSGCWMCDPMHSARLRYSNLAAEALEIVQARCMTKSPQGVITYIPPAMDRAIEMVALAIEHGRTVKPAKEMPGGPAGDRLDFIEWSIAEKEELELTSA